jgi:glycosyltransferase 2 family protein
MTAPDPIDDVAPGLVDGLAIDGVVPGPSRRSLAIRTTVGTAISLVALWLVFRTVDVEQALRTLATASPAWIAVMFVAIAADIATRVVRWWVLLRPVGAVRLLRTGQYLTTGYAANNVLPARLGELVRAHYLGDREGMSRSTALGTIVVERVVDFTALVAIAGTALVVLGVRGEIGSAVLVGVAISVVLVVGLVIVLVGHRLPGAGRAITAAERYPRVHSLAATFRVGIAVAGRSGTMVPAVLLTLLAWSCTIVTFAAGAQAVGIELAWSQAALLAAGVNLVTAIPAGPGFIGTWELAAVRILATFGVAGDTAFAFALLVHVSTLAATTIAGAISFLRIGWLPSVKGRPVGDGADVEPSGS